MRSTPGKRLLCVYQHAPTPGAPGIYRHRRFFAELVRRGWHVDVVSSPRNYMTGAVPARYSGRLHVSETIDGIRHHWVWSSAGIHESRWRRAANYVTFAASAAIRAATLPKPDVVLVSSPPLTVGALGPLLGVRTRKWVLEVRDAWPESAVSVGWLSERSFLYRVLDRLARRLASTSSAVVVPTPGLTDTVVGHGARSVVVVPGSVFDANPSAETRKRARESLGVEPQTCLFVYVGAIGVANGLELLLDAAGLLPEDAPVTIVLAGDGSARADLERRVAEEQIPVRLIGAVPINRVPDLLAASDVCLHMLRPDPVFATAQPSKVLEYLGSHRPFITSVPGLPQRLALESGGGFAATAEDLALELMRWVRMPEDERRERGEKSYRYGSREFSFQEAVDRLESVLLAAESDSDA